MFVCCSIRNPTEPHSSQADLREIAASDSLHITTRLHDSRILSRPVSSHTAETAANRKTQAGVSDFTSLLS